MPRKPLHTPFVCEFFTWRLFDRDGVFYADGRSGKHDLGKHSLGTRDREQAIAQLKNLDYQKAVELGFTDAVQTPTIDNISIAEGWKLYFDFSGRSDVQGGVSPGTLKRYRAVRDKHIKFCARHGIASWVTFDVNWIQKYGNWLSKHYAYRTEYFELTLLKTVVSWLINKQRLPAACKLYLPLRKPQGTDTYCYSLREVSAMVEHCEGIPAHTWLGHVIVALAHTGMRISELAGLRWSDVSLDQNSICVADERASRHRRKANTARTTKGRRSRNIPLHRELKSTLLAIPKQADGYVFHATMGGRLRSRNVLQAFIDDVIEPLKMKFPTPADEIGFKHGRLHSFRHFFCSQAFLGGASEGEIREWLGHRDSKMVEHYRHLRNDDAQRKMEKIDFLDRQDNRSGDVA
jgi:integrase